ncbi:hypothetical protein BD560DRAFT_432131 [Blakeslea trispora]|nr:hypothetical protein BD560DRAFT_432131 [Blakeslea trispora]
MPGLTFESIVCEMRLLKNEILDKEIDLEPCVKANELVEFERTNLIRFPADYRIFLLEVGNGVESDWLGPCREGILSFGKTPFGYPLRFSDLLKNLGKAFPYTQKHIVEETEEQQDTRITNRPRHREIGGYVTLGTSIRSYSHFWILICEGESRGEVWIATWHGSFFPCTPRMSFRDWLMDWLQNNGDLMEQSLMYTQRYPQSISFYSLRRDAEGEEDSLNEMSIRPSSYFTSSSRARRRSVQFAWTPHQSYLH